MICLLVVLANEWGSVTITGVKGIHCVKNTVLTCVHWYLDASKEQGLRAGLGTAHAVWVLAWLSVVVPLAAAVGPGPPSHRYPVLRKFQHFADVALQQKHLTGDWG